MLSVKAVIFFFLYNFGINSIELLSFVQENNFLDLHDSVIIYYHLFIFAFNYFFSHVSDSNNLLRF